MSNSYVHGEETQDETPVVTESSAPDTSSQSAGLQSSGGTPCHRLENLPGATLMSSPPLTGHAVGALPTLFC